jgi:Family of unknown function (DUF6962)
MPIAEPTTTLTDYLIAAVALALGTRLLRAAGGRTSARLWAATFFATAAAAVVGGTSHGFAPHIGPALHALLWRITYSCIGLANLFLLAGGLYAVTAGTLRRALLTVVGLRFAVFAAFILTGERSFGPVILDLAVTLAALLAIGLVLHLGRREPAGTWILGAVALSLIGASVQRSGLGLHADLNHNDLFHLIQTAGLYLFYRGGRCLRDRAPVPARTAGRLGSLPS